MLPSLEIKNFRMLEDFRVEKLGRVNLIVGKNNSGKSSVLEALRIYAGNANRGLLTKIAREHDERTRPWDSEQGESSEEFPFEDLVTGRKFRADGKTKIVIGSAENDPEALSIAYGFYVEISEMGAGGERRSIIRLHPAPPPKDYEKEVDVIAPCLIVRKRGGSTAIRLDEDMQLSRFRSPEVGSIPCGTVPTQFLSLDELADEWDKIALTENQSAVKEALRIVTPEFEEITFVRSEGVSQRRLLRTARVKLTTMARPVSLGSLGDGMLRVLQLSLRIFSARGGFFLIDEFENGLHYSVQEKIWALLFKMATKLDVQIFATTHSWDCIESFARAAQASDAEGVLFRMGKSVLTSERGRVISTVFDEERLFNITQSEVEVR